MSVRGGAQPFGGLIGTIANRFGRTSVHGSLCFTSHAPSETANLEVDFAIMQHPTALVHARPSYDQRVALRQPAIGERLRPGAGESSLARITAT
jgi:hypothetical protein